MHTIEIFSVVHTQLAPAMLQRFSLPLSDASSFNIDADCVRTCLTTLSQSHFVLEVGLVTLRDSPGFTNMLHHDRRRLNSFTIQCVVCRAVVWRWIANLTTSLVYDGTRAPSCIDRGTLAIMLVYLVDESAQVVFHTALPTSFFVICRIYRHRYVHGSRHTLMTGALKSVRLATHSNRLAVTF